MGIAVHLVVMSFAVVHVCAGANEPIADNELGLTARDCAASYCTSKDGMELWLSLSQACAATANPYFAARPVSKPAEALWTPVAVGTVSAAVALAGLALGFVSGRKFTDASAPAVELRSRRSWR